MKIAFAGKGGVGKTTLTAWLGNYLARQGKDTWLVDADTALSLGVACGLGVEELPEALGRAEGLIQERIGAGLMCLNPDVSDLPERMAVELPMFCGEQRGRQWLLLMGRVEEGGGGCACGANALLKAFLAHMFFEESGYVLVDMEAGVEHLGRGTVAAVDGLVVVAEPGLRSLLTAAEVSRLARQLGLERQVLVLNRYQGEVDENACPLLPDVLLGQSGLADLPALRLAMPVLAALTDRQWTNGCVLFGKEDASSRELVDAFCERLLALLATGEGRGAHRNIAGRSVF